MTLHIADDFRAELEAIDFSPERVFTDPAVVPWRALPDRENCVWNLPQRKLHVKRYKAGRAAVEAEAAGYAALHAAGIATATCVLWGVLSDGRAFIATEDLAGYVAADKLLEKGIASPEQILPRTADIAARLHNANLHHRDLYLCHFLFREPGVTDAEPRLIDAARVRPLPRGLLRRRWIVKDLAQHWYSTLALPITDHQRQAWLDRYVQLTKISRPDALRRAIIRKARAIGRHDQRLRLTQPRRNISIPVTGGE